MFGTHAWLRDDFYIRELLEQEWASSFQEERDVRSCVLRRKRVSLKFNKKTNEDMIKSARKRQFIEKEMKSLSTDAASIGC